MSVLFPKKNANFGRIFETSVNFEHFVNGRWTHYYSSDSKKRYGSQKLLVVCHSPNGKASGGEEEWFSGPALGLLWRQLQATKKSEKIETLAVLFLFFVKFHVHASFYDYHIEGGNRSREEARSAERSELKLYHLFSSWMLDTKCLCLCLTIFLWL